MVLEQCYSDKNLSNDEAFSMSNLADIPLFSRAGGTVTESKASPFDTSPFGRSVKVYTTSEVSDLWQTY